MMDGMGMMDGVGGMMWPMGLVGLLAWNVYLTDRVNSLQQQFRAQFPNNDAYVGTAMERWRAENPEPRATLSQVADHIDHVRTQLPYALLAGGAATILYALVGATL